MSPAPQGCRCGEGPELPRLDRALLDRSLDLGERFLLANQRPEGKFNYEYDWRTRTQSKDDNPVRQAGAHCSQPALRIDVMQHQMHAVILARRYYEPLRSAPAPGAGRR